MRPKEFESFLNSQNAIYLLEIYSEYKRNPAGVPEDWVQFFQSLGDDLALLLADLESGNWSPRSKRKSNNANPVSGESPETTSNLPKTKAEKHDPIAPSITKENSNAIHKGALVLKASSIAESYRNWGHFSANLDPLGLSDRPKHPTLNPEYHGIREEDMDVPILGFKIGRRDTIRGIIEQLSKVYCSQVGAEYTHIPNMEEVEWIKRRLETVPYAPTHKDKKEILEWLMKAELFENFLAKKFPGAKRFGLEGVDAFIPLMRNILIRAAYDECGSVVIGMAHRGRLNVLYNLIGLPYENIFAKFKGKAPENILGSGDVKYHIGGSKDITLHDQSLNVSLMYNPSHLEAVNPVVAGNVHAKQEDGYPNAFGITVHGDAAFPGQGVNAETMLISQVEGYCSGGTIHIITNNQIGFTAEPKESRSTAYSSDLAKSINSPIFHVNADDAESVTFVSWLAYEYRKKFKKDVVIDLIGYRKHGHNEGDEPMFTNPVLYNKIKIHPSAMNKYAKKIEKQNIVLSDEFNTMQTEFLNTLEKAFEASNTYSVKLPEWKVGGWKEIKSSTEKSAEEFSTGVSKSLIKSIGTTLSTPPENFDLNKKIERQLLSRKEVVESGKGFDWAMGELLAFGTLLSEGYPVRLSGEDSVRGTFSHRHAGIYDQSTGNLVLPLQNSSEKKAKFTAFNSPLSEYAVMGYEYGVSLSNPNRLVIWEAQFGDFSNGAQIIIDQFIASGETKWNCMSGLVLMLPHGFEGQGPEHSSARIERFLQLCAEDNMRVVNPTTPANVFHALRRQIHSNYRKPLVMFTPKSLLRHKLAVSNMEDFTEESKFQSVIPDSLKNAERVVFCSGKIYYDLLEARAAHGLDSKVALVRIEQLYPFPLDEIKSALKSHKNPQIIWCQEEPENMGAWQFVFHKLRDTLGDGLKYVGRKSAASPATGYGNIHAIEQNEIIEKALGLKG